MRAPACSAMPRRQLAGRRRDRGGARVRARSGRRNPLHFWHHGNAKAARQDLGLARRRRARAAGARAGGGRRDDRRRGTAAAHVGPGVHGDAAAAQRLRRGCVLPAAAGRDRRHARRHTRRALARRHARAPARLRALGRAPARARRRALLDRAAAGGHGAPRRAARRRARHRDLRQHRDRRHRHPATARTQVFEAVAGIEIAMDGEARRRARRPPAGARCRSTTCCSRWAAAASRCRAARPTS